MKTSLSILPILLLARTAAGEPGQCEEISIPMCKEIGYNFTRLPNQFNHESQDEVSLRLCLLTRRGEGQCLVREN